MYTLPLEDLDNISERLISYWPSHQKILITGGTGFFGRWIVESISWIENKINAGNIFYIPSRQSEVDICCQIPVLNQFIFKKIQCDIEKKSDVKKIQQAGPYDFIIHAATDVSLLKSGMISEDNFGLTFLDNLMTDVQSVRLKKLLYISSGGVYNKKKLEPCSEDDLIEIDLLNTYSKIKILNEKKIENLISKNKYSIARCFSFLGPFVNNDMISMQVINKKIENKKVNLSSPEAIRSFMYPSDLVISLFMLLLNKTKNNVYNVGSEEAITIGDFVNILQIEWELVSKQVLSLAGTYYYPSTERLDSEFKNLNTINLKIAIEKTLKFQIERAKK